MKEDKQQEDYYVKFNLNPQVGSGITNASYMLRELKQIINMLNGYRQNKAQLRKELYETLVSLRLTADKYKNLVPANEAEMLEKKMKEISTIVRAPHEARTPLFTRKEPIAEKKRPVPPQFQKKKAAPKDKELFNDALDSEKRELELLKQDLEDISNQLRKRK